MQMKLKPMLPRGPRFNLPFQSVSILQHKAYNDLAAVKQNRCGRCVMADAGSFLRLVN